MRWIVAPIVRDGAPQMEGGALFERNDVIKKYYSDAGSAHTEAKNRASKSPGLVMGVFTIDTVYETTTPTVLEKFINATGELVLKPAEATRG